MFSVIVITGRHYVYAQVSEPNTALGCDLSFSMEITTTKWTYTSSKASNRNCQQHLHSSESFQFVIWFILVNKLTLLPLSLHLLPQLATSKNRTATARTCYVIRQIIRCDRREEESLLMVSTVPGLFSLCIMQMQILPAQSDQKLQSVVQISGTAEGDRTPKLK